ncbi:GNAT family N-acetyltransferase [Cellulomonas palmilytica]|uniref:GNAT family N-acetyltransferase n=1 Tax=Cellulomonas palmilytica TaxID=2608402 RepID=UPI001F2F33EC|nr:GNAT family N-acetyltransferase [Cellulomonas palmilytica]UJP41332.1 GNAT family N-acetyltransferase [Cellulomonas palmilytica]
MTVTVREASPADRALVGRLLDLCLHEFSEFDGLDIGWDGSYAYPWLEAYWVDHDRQAYVFDVEGHPAGFALVRLTKPVELAEFFVLRKYRRQGVGTDAAGQVIARHPGRWVISQAGANARATAFWRRAVPSPFVERREADGRVVRTFETVS